MNQFLIEVVAFNSRFLKLEMNKKLYHCFIPDGFLAIFTTKYYLFFQNLLAANDVISQIYVAKLLVHLVKIFLRFPYLLKDELPDLMEIVFLGLFELSYAILGNELTLIPFRHLLSRMLPINFLSI